MSETKKVVIPGGGEESQVLVKYIRDTSGKAISMIQGTNTYYFMYNAHGDVTGLTDSSGNIVATYTYDEFGNLQSSTGNIYNPLRYSGANNAYFDEETASASSGQAGLYKMGTRYYDSSIGRWITRDSFKGEQELPQTQNKYIYVENNPLNKADRTGLWGDDVHYNMTFDNAIYNAYFVPIRYARKMAQGSKDMDNKHNWAGSSLTNLRYHFDFKGSLIKRFNRAYGTAKYFLRKRNKKKAYNWLGRGLHSLQDYYSHPPGWMGVAFHLAENTPVIVGKRYAGKDSVLRWYAKRGSRYDSPKNNSANFGKANRRTNKIIQSFQRYANRY